jgi:hypothetical protein
MTTLNTVTAEQASKIAESIRTVRTDSDTKAGLKFLNLHTMQTLVNNEIDLNSFESIVKQREGDNFTIAQKSFKRAMRMLNGIANNNFSPDFVPFEITASLINYAHFEGKVSGQLATAFITRLIELDEQTQARAGNKLKLKNRDTKSVNTASAQSSSVKGMLRALGALNSKKHSREAVADIESPIFKSAMTAITKTLDSKGKALFK